MSFLFSKSVRKFQEYTEKGWLYFFLTRPQPNDRQAFIKFGLTERTLISRLSDYISLDLANIYAIQVPETELKTREGAMKQIFKVCKEASDVDIWCHSGYEYLKGNLDLMLKVFLHFSTIPYDIAVKYHSNTIIVNLSEILEWLDDLHPIDYYKIQMLTPKKIHKMSPEVTNILDIENDIAGTKALENIDSDNETDNQVEENQCNRCGRQCKDKRGLSIHMRVCEGTTVFTCQYCNTVFSSVYSLSIHTTRCPKHKELLKKKDDSLQQENQQLKIQLQELENKYKEERQYCKSTTEEQLINQYSLELLELRAENKRLLASTEEKEKMICKLERWLDEEKRIKHKFINVVAKLQGLEDREYDIDI